MMDDRKEERYVNLALDLRPNKRWSVDGPFSVPRIVPYSDALITISDIITLHIVVLV